MSFTVKEIIDIAVEIEQAGHEFYKRCSTSFTDEKIKGIFELLSSEELVHKKKFESMLVDADKAEGIFSEEYYLYLKAIGGGKVFGEDALRDAAMVMTEDEAVKKAFHDEKNSILFYTELKELYKTDKNTLLVLEGIIEEERRHIATLMELMNTINKK